MAVSEILLSENPEAFFLCAAFQPGDVGSTLVVGDAGEGRSETLSKTESLFVDRGELGADEAMNSDCSSAGRDQRLGEYTEGSLCGGDNNGPASVPRWKRADDIMGEAGAENCGGAKTPAVSPCLLFLGFRASGLCVT
jgi:hypothetical protein